MIFPEFSRSKELGCFKEDKNEIIKNIWLREGYLFLYDVWSQEASSF